jgi:hypothetical protein
MDAIIAALAKYPSMVKDARKIADTGNEAALSIKRFTDLMDQVFPT